MSTRPLDTARRARSGFTSAGSEGGGAAGAHRPTPPPDVPSGWAKRADRPLRAPREISLTRASLVVTIVGLVMFEAGMLVAVADAVGAGSARRTLEAVVFTAVVSFLVYGNLVYQAARLGYLTRRREHRPATRAELDELYHCSPRPLVALLPSYREEPRVIRQALLAAALQEYPDKRVVLLIDDPPTVSDPDARRLLAAARSLPGDLESLPTAGAWTV